jgi:hypothetical protein
MPIGHQDHQCVPRAVSSPFPGRLDELLDLGSRQIFAVAIVGVEPPAGRLALAVDLNCS